MKEPIEEDLQQVDSLWDVALALFPPDQWSVLILIALATFSVTQMIKVVFKLRVDSNDLGPMALRIFSALSAFPLAWGLWPVKQLPAVVAVGFVGWLLAHALAEYGMRIFRAVAPNLYRRFNAEPDRRFEDRGPRRGQTERRKP